MYVSNSSPNSEIVRLGNKYIDEVKARCIKTINTYINSCKTITFSLCPKVLSDLISSNDFWASFMLIDPANELNSNWDPPVLYLKTIIWTHF